jgi:hypothetical protein
MDLFNNKIIMIKIYFYALLKLSIPEKNIIADKVFLATAIGTPLKNPINPSYLNTYLIK